MKRFRNRALVCCGGERCLGSWSCLPWGIPGIAVRPRFLSVAPLETPVSHAGPVHDGACVSRNQAFLDGVREAEEPSNLPADLHANIFPSPALTTLRPSWTGQGQVLPLESLGRVEERPHLP